MTYNTERPYILASKSPRRIEIMRNHGIEPLIMPADIDENIPPVHGMCETVMFLALKKAQAVEQNWLDSLRAETGSCSGSESPLQENTVSEISIPSPAPVILAADTIVWKDGEIMGKPEDKADGFRMLSKLRNSAHQVITGVCLLEAGSQHTEVFAVVTDVYFTDYSDEELNAYLDTDEAYDKAGGYAIQGYFGKFIEKFDGSYDNVVGFPWAEIEEKLQKF